jgi:O-antigen/teichoic acid export membrane protein
VIFFRALLRSPSLRAALALGCGGIAFTLSNLLFARELSSGEYGLLLLFIGILSVAMLGAPLGLDQILARRGLPFGPYLRRWALVACVLTGVLTAIVAALVYGLSADMLIALGVATAATGACLAAVAHFQGQRQFGIAAWLLQIMPNMALAPVALLAMIPSFRSASRLSGVLAAAGVICFAGAWCLVVSRQPSAANPPRLTALWREALSLVGITMASAVFLQLERLVLVPTVGVHDLALYGVVASLVGSPFRMIQSAVLFTLIPEMRAAQGVRTRRRLLAREIAIVSAALVCGAVVLWLIAPPIAHWFLGGRYDLSSALMLAAIVSGLLKVCSAFATSIVVALGDERDLRHTGLSAGSSVVLACVGAFLAAPWGLTGVLYGISAGWLVRTLAAIWVAVPHLLQNRSDLPYPVR